MLRELHIANLAVIEDARIELRPGLNVFTGQTGAGKSLVLGAFEILLGRRAAASMLRRGAQEGRVSGLFDIEYDEVRVQIARLSDMPDEEAHAFIHDREPLLLTRKLFASGRSSVSINGHPGTASMLRRIGEFLIDVQAGDDGAATNTNASSSTGVAGAMRDLQLLLKPANQLDVLDLFAQLATQRQAYHDVYIQLRETRRRRDELSTNQTLRAEQLDLYRFQANEIDDVEPTEGEFEELMARHRVMANLQRLTRDGQNIHRGLYDGDDAISERLHYTLALIRELAELDPVLVEVRELVESATASVQDAAFTLGRYLSRLDIDPGELAEVNDRLNALNRLIAKYGNRGGCLADVLAYRAELDERIDELEDSDTSIDRLERQVAELSAQLDSLSTELHESRQEAATRIRPLIEAQLADLAMKDAQLEIEITELDEPGAYGSDAIEIMLRTNPGQPMRPLRQIASGGELSRIMLALKTVLAPADRTSVLVFDEIDARIGGRLGTVIGSKLKSLAQRHQVLCITHLPQIAAFGDHHLRIIKTTDGSETRTTVDALADDKSRVAELAEMLAGTDITVTTRKQARELLKTARKQ